MTWSVVARDPETGAFGVAVATRFFAVGALCPHLSSGKGALATQALINPTYGRRGLALLEQDVPAADVVRILTEADAGCAVRQLHVVDRQGRVAQHTGPDCIDWCGHVAGHQISVAGNMLAGPAVIAATLAAYQANRTAPLAERLIAALEAGEAAGGDKRGKQSAALRIHTTEDYPALDLRVDDHPEPLAELRRLHAVASDYFVHFAQHLATRADPVGTVDRERILSGVEAARAAAR